MRPSPCASIVSCVVSKLLSAQVGIFSHSGASTGSPFSAISPVGAHTTGSLGPSGSPFSSTNVPSQRNPFGLDRNDRVPTPFLRSVVSSHWFGRPALYWSTHPASTPWKSQPANWLCSGLPSRLATRFVDCRQNPSLEFSIVPLPAQPRSP